MFTVWICIECLHRILREQAAPCPQQSLRRGKKKKKRPRLKDVSKKKKKRCQLKMFSNVTV